jgi:uncharacterized membrane protein
MCVCGLTTLILRDNNKKEFVHKTILLFRIMGFSTLAIFDLTHSIDFKEQRYISKSN